MTIMDSSAEEDLLQRLWPGSSSSIRRAAASILLQDPDNRLRVSHLEVLLKAALNRDVTSLELQTELGSSECTKYFHIIPGSEWQTGVVKLVRDALAQGLQQAPLPPPSQFPWFMPAALETEHEKQVLNGVLNTWSSYTVNDEDYLAVVIAWVLITRKDSKGVLPAYSLHLTDVGGFLRSISVSDSRLAAILSRTAGGGIFANDRQRQKHPTKARPRLSEYLTQQRYKAYFNVRDSSVRKSEKVVTLAVEKLAASSAAQDRECLSTGPLDQVQATASGVQSTLSNLSGAVTAAPFVPAAVLPDFLDGMDAPEPPRLPPKVHLRPREDRNLYNLPADLNTSSPALTPYLDPVIDQPVHPWHHRSSSLFSLSSAGSLPALPPATPHLTPATSRFCSSFPDMHLPHSLDAPLNVHPAVPAGMAASADVACSNLMAAFNPEPTFYHHHGVEYVGQVPDVIAKCWSAPLDELITSRSDATETLAPYSNAPHPVVPLMAHDDGCSDDGSVSLEDCMIPEDSDCGDSDRDDIDPVAAPAPPQTLMGKRLGASAGANAGQQLLKLLSTSSSAAPAPEVVQVPSFTPSTPSFFPGPSQARNMGSSTDSDLDAHSSAQSNSSDDPLEQCRSPGAAFTGTKTVTVSSTAKPPTAGNTPSSFAAVAAAPLADAPVATIQTGANLSNWAKVAAKHTSGDGKAGKEVVFAPPPTAESKVAAAAAAAQVVLPPGAAKNLAKLSARLRDEVLRVVKICPAMKLEDFDEGVVAQLMAKKSEEDAAAAIKSISLHDLTNIQHMAAFINFVVKNYAGAGTTGASAVRGSIGGLVSRGSSVPVSSRTILQKLPLKVYKRLEEVVNECGFLEWKHFDAGVVKVLSQLAKMAEDDVCEELDILLQTDLSNVEYMPAYLNKRFNNRLWSRRKVSA